MGASESTARPNATNKEEEEEDKSQQQNTISGGSLIRAGTVVAAAVAGVGIAAYGISKMLTDDSDNQQRDRNDVLLGNSLDLIAPRSRSKWSPLPTGRVKMNTDGRCLPEKIYSDDRVQRGPSGYGGILRDHHGNWVRGFMGFIDESDCLTSEFYGILKGLEVLDKLEHKGAILETDCEAAYKWVTREDEDDPGKSEIIRSCWSEIIKCRELAKKNAVTILHVSRGENQCADKLAKMAIERKEPYVEIEDWEDVPCKLRSLVDKDKMLT